MFPQVTFRIPLIPSFGNKLWACLLNRALVATIALPWPPVVLPCPPRISERYGQKAARGAVVWYGTETRLLTGKMFPLHASGCCSQWML